MINGGYSSLCFESSVCVFLLFGNTGWGYMLPVFLWGQLTFLSWGFPSSTFCGTGFVGT